METLPLPVVTPAEQRQNNTPSITNIGKRDALPLNLKPYYRQGIIRTRDGPTAGRLYMSWPRTERPHGYDADLLQIDGKQYSWVEDTPKAVLEPGEIMRYNDRKGGSDIAVDEVWSVFVYSSNTRFHAFIGNLRVMRRALVNDHTVFYLGRA